MLLKSIKLKNFRQFIDTNIEFSTDKEKNVTFVLANNYTGKTTIASAFTWCLFGRSGLPDGILLNRKINNNLKAREEVTVEVEVELQYGNKNYCVKRVQTYTNTETLYGKPKLDFGSTKLYVTYRDSETGLTKGIEENKIQDMMNLIIPQDLADYFFMKAEQINTMGQNVQNRHSTADFSSAVKKILGMQAIENAIKHLTEQKNSTQSLFQQKYNGNSNEQIKQLQNKLDNIKKTIDNNKDDIEKANENINRLNNRNANLIAEIEKWADSAKEQEKINNAHERIKTLETVLKSSKERSLNDFRKNLSSYCIQFIAPKVLHILKETKVEDKNVPNVNDKTIEFLLKRGKCICACKLEIGNKCYSELEELLSYVPPKYIGTTIAEYINEIKIRTGKDSMVNLSLEFEQNKTMWLSLQKQIDEAYEVVENSRKNLKEHRDTAQLENERSSNEEMAKDLAEKITNKRIENSRLENEKESKEKELEKVSQEDSANKHISDCINHVKYIAMVLKNYLADKEEKLCQMMIDKINETFSTVFTSNYRINLDEKYRLSITDTIGTPQDIDTSGAQSVFVVLAFITSVLYLAQQIHYKKLKNKDDMDFLITEPYPLVLDAPFSAFDKESTTKACEKLPYLTEQIIIFSKDIEGNIIKETMRDKIGKYYTMKAATIDGNERDVLETNVEEGDINAVNI